MTHLVLVKPPEQSRFNFGTFSLGVLAAAVRHLARITILDMTTQTMQDAVEKILDLDPDMIGITAMGLNSVEPVAALIHRIRGNFRSRQATILAGGHGASMFPAPLLAAGADVVVVGEGELTLQGILADGIVPGMAGTLCLVRDEIITGPMRAPIWPLDRLAPPARDLMPPPKDEIQLMESSRGCPHECAFCEATRFHGRRWRPHSPEWVADEVRRLVEDYDAWIIHIADDNFAASPRRVIQICEAVKHGPQPVFVMVSARADDLLAEPGVLPAMAAARILRVTVGVETTEPRMAEKIGKPTSAATYRATFARMRELGMFSIASFIIGLPGETAEMRIKAVEWAVEIGPDSAHFLPFLPLPGIPLALGRDGCEPEPGDVRDACLFTEEFFSHPVARRRLEEAADGEGVRSLLARATLERKGGMRHESNYGLCRPTG